MISTRRKNNPFRWFLLSLVGCCLLLLTTTITRQQVQAQPDIHPQAAFVEFWSDYESIFLFHPHLVKQIFFDLVNLKGNRRSALSLINKKVLSCTTGTGALSECRLDQLKLERKKLKFSRTVAVYANVTSIRGQPFKKDKSRYLLTIRWQPTMVQPPVMSVGEFFHYLGVASESKRYQAKKNLDHIQINPLFDDRVTIVTSKARAMNLLKLYRNPPSDFKDTFIFRASDINMKKVGRTANFNLHLKAVKVKINHLTFQTTKELIQ